jgi:hypothetical protein
MHRVERLLGALCVAVVALAGCTQLIGADWSGHFAVKDASVDVSILMFDGGPREARSDADGGTDGGAPRASCSLSDAGDTCVCLPAGPDVPANDAGCSLSTLHDPSVSTCCRDPSWPQEGYCVCSAFLCYANGFGGTSCYFQDRQSGEGPATTSATGDVCCIQGADGGFGAMCTCYPSVLSEYCDLLTHVAKCDEASIPACSSILTTGYDQVPSCP